MLDQAKHIAYWGDGAKDDWESAELLVAKGKVRQGLFFAHLALEKALKAHVAKATGALPPRTHNLRHLAELGGVAPDEAQMAVLLEANEFNLAGRYPDSWPDLPSREAVAPLLARMHGVLEWLLRKL